MKKVSVIIPVYNSSKYLKECLDSVINQTYQNLEIIIINDNSNDNSLSIINSFILSFSFLFFIILVFALGKESLISI